MSQSDLACGRRVFLDRLRERSETWIWFGFLDGKPLRPHEFRTGVLPSPLAISILSKIMPPALCGIRTFVRIGADSDPSVCYFNLGRHK